MSLIESLRQMFNGHTSEKIAAKLSEVEIELSERTRTLEEAEHDLAERGALARIKGGRSPDRTRLYEARAALEELEAARDGLKNALAEAQAKDRSEDAKLCVEELRAHAHVWHRRKCIAALLARASAEVIGDKVFSELQANMQPIVQRLHASLHRAQDVGWLTGWKDNRHPIACDVPLDAIVTKILKALEDVDFGAAPEEAEGFAAPALETELDHEENLKRRAAADKAERARFRAEKVEPLIADVHQLAKEVNEGKASDIKRRVMALHMRVDDVGEGNGRLTRAEWSELKSTLGKLSGSRNSAAGAGMFTRVS